MGKLFLDENEIVQFDPSRNGAWSRQAATGRGILRLSDLASQLIQEIGKARAFVGRGDPGETAEGLLELDGVRHRIRAQAHRRPDAVSAHS